MTPAPAWERELHADLARQAEVNTRAAAIVGAYKARSEGASIVEGMLHALEDRAASAGPPPTWAGVHRRAVEHIVTEPGTTAATPHGLFPVATSWVADLAESWSTAAMPITGATAIVEVDAGRGAPALPAVTVAPTAGPQGGEKKALYSKAFKLGAATATTIDATLFLNFSAQLEATPAAELGRAMMQAAVADEADRQVGEAIVADATVAADLDAALAAFDTGRHLPAVLLAPPSQLSALPSATDLAAAGIRIVLAHLDQPVLIGAGAVTGWLLPLQATAIEPSVAGIGRGYAMFGAVAVDPTGAATWTPTP